MDKKNEKKPRWIISNIPIKKYGWFFARTLALFGILFVQSVVQVMISLTNERRGPKRSYKKEGILRRLQIFRVPYSIPSERIRKKDYMTFFAISNLLLDREGFL